MSCLKVRLWSVDTAVGGVQRGERTRGEDGAGARGHGDDRESGEVVLEWAGGGPVLHAKRSADDGMDKESEVRTALTQDPRAGRR